ncbi:MAG TPA: protease inhibitor I42 family protein [Geomonas sp.]|nr:protease inhibitor I42 family protein [Geomonas sp.]
MREPVARKALRRLLAALLVTVAGTGCAAPGASGRNSSEIAIDRHAEGSTVSLRRGQRLIVSLPGNPTTGFVWEELPGAAPVLIRQGEPSYTTKGTALGAGGLYRFSYLAQETGQVPLRFVYRRPFEAGVVPGATFHVTVEVTQ